MTLDEAIGAVVREGFVVLPVPLAECEISVQGAVVRLRWPVSNPESAAQKLLYVAGLQKK